jgi:hypothetical protein
MVRRFYFFYRLSRFLLLGTDGSFFIDTLHRSTLFRIVIGTILCFSVIGLCYDAFIILLELSSDLGKVDAVDIKEIAVFYYFIDVCVELRRSNILVSSQIALNCGKIHRLLDNLAVMRNPHFLGINWFSKRPRSLTVLEHV